MTTFALPWPLPAVAAWLAAWSVHAALAPTGAAAAFAGGCAVGGAVAMTARGTWRRALAAGGFPLSALAVGGLPGWAWLAALAPLALAYPLRAWRDAPFFPTPAAALDGIADVVALPPDASILDAGCGLGHGLAALARAWPDARLAGIEWSRPLAWLAARRLPAARIARGDMWAASWTGHDCVYVFQRPESMARVRDKAEAELAPGAWLVSLEFEVPDRTPVARVGGRPAWVYRVGAGRSLSTAAPRRR